MYAYLFIRLFVVRWSGAYLNRLTIPNSILDYKPYAPEWIAKEMAQQ